MRWAIQRPVMTASLPWGAMWDTTVSLCSLDEDAQALKSMMSVISHILLSQATDRASSFQGPEHSSNTNSIPIPSQKAQYSSKPSQEHLLMKL